MIQNHDVDPTQVQRSSKGNSKENTIKGTDLMLRDLAVTGKKENEQATSTTGAFVRFDLELQAWLDTQEKALINETVNDELASTEDDMLIDIDSNDSPKAEKKPAPLPSGCIIPLVRQLSSLAMAIWSARIIFRRVSDCFVRQSAVSSSSWSLLSNSLPFALSAGVGHCGCGNIAGALMCNEGALGVSSNDELHQIPKKLPFWGNRVQAIRG